MFLTRIKGQLCDAAKFFEFLTRSMAKVALRMKVDILKKLNMSNSRSSIFKIVAELRSQNQSHIVIWLRSFAFPPRSSNKNVKTKYKKRLLPKNMFSIKKYVFFVKKNIFFSQNNVFT